MENSFNFGVGGRKDVKPDPQGRVYRGVKNKPYWKICIYPQLKTALECDVTVQVYK